MLKVGGVRSTQTLSLIHAAKQYNKFSPSFYKRPKAPSHCNLLSLSLSVPSISNKGYLDMQVTHCWLFLHHCRFQIHPAEEPLLSYPPREEKVAVHHTLAVFLIQEQPLFLRPSDRCPVVRTGHRPPLEKFRQAGVTPSARGESILSRSSPP